MISGRCITTFATANGDFAEVYRHNNRYSLRINHNQTLVSEVSADQMLSVVAGYATRSATKANPDK